MATATDNAAPLTKGTVTSEHAAEGCPWLVRIDDAGGTRYLIPVALEDKYLRDGSHITFTYRPSRANSGNCGLGDPAILEGVKVIGR
ncbi:MAG: hypothetical protein H6597_04415 [Flavobacteriales bacterium]|nr:hypothetical protein [Flavobacteriales bacterium]